MHCESKTVQPLVTLVLNKLRLRTHPKNFMIFLRIRFFFLVFEKILVMQFPYMKNHLS